MARTFVQLRPLAQPGAQGLIDGWVLKAAVSYITEILVSDGFCSVNGEGRNPGQGENSGTKCKKGIPLGQSWSLPKNRVVEQGSNCSPEVTMHIGPSHDRSRVFATDILGVGPNRWNTQITTEVAILRPTTIIHGSQRDSGFGR